ncbi:cytochrome P450 [Nocardioides sp. NPDC006273]|uniref:cytochrome P450 n=1 Tax=Nocardioides sp. NPDC006273 TaxID=3155598 RepID=UPI0033B52CA6
MTPTIPSTDADLFADDVIADPHPTYRELRDAGPALWMSRYECWVLPRYAEAFAALRDHDSFSSGSGVALNEVMNQATKGGSVLCTDPPDHDLLRRILGTRLTPRALRGHSEDFTRRAHVLVDELIEKGSFDAVADFSSAFPLSVVPDLLGVPEDGREHLLTWASAAFQAEGPMNERTQASLPSLQEFLEYMSGVAGEEKLTPGSWGHQMLLEARSGEIDEKMLPLLLLDYLGPSIDTTISALSTAIWQFALHPDQWDELRRDRSLIANVVNEAVRLEAPIRGFARHLTRDYDIDGVTLPAGDWVFVSYASANRDERRWEDPGRFDIYRDTAGHVGFGSGIHSCVGQGLAKLEANALFNALADRVSRFELAGEPVWNVHNILRGISTLPVTIHS